MFDCAPVHKGGAWGGGVVGNNGRSESAITTCLYIKGGGGVGKSGLTRDRWIKIHTFVYMYI